MFRLYENDVQNDLVCCGLQAMGGLLYGDFSAENGSRWFNLHNSTANSGFQRSFCLGLVVYSCACLMLCVHELTTKRDGNEGLVVIGRVVGTEYDSPEPIEALAAVVDAWGEKLAVAWACVLRERRSTGG